jgi:lysophospholipase L1-like esterase
VFYRFLQHLNPATKLVNVSIPGADSCVMINGKGGSSPCTDPLIPGSVPSQLDAAVAFLKANPGQVDPITLNVGGDDLLPLIPLAATDPAGASAKLPALFAAYAANLDKILSTLRANAPNSQIILANQYNPLGGIGSPPLPTGFPDLAASAIKSLDDIMTATAAKYNVEISNVFASFNAAPHGAASLTYVPATLPSGITAVNIHPTTAGYAVMGQTVIDTYFTRGVPLSATLATAKVTAKLQYKALAPGLMQVVTGKAPPNATLTITAHFPKVKTPAVYHTATQAPGLFAAGVRVDGSHGTAIIRVCAKTRAGVVGCSQALKMTVQ